MIFCTGQWLLGVRCWGGFLALPSCRSAIWTSRCPSPSWMKTNPLAYEDEPLALLCLPAHCCLSVIRLWQASLLLLFLLPLNVPTKDLVTQCGRCVLADLQSVQQLSSWQQVRGLELAVPLWKCSVTLWFGLVSKPWASKQWKRCKCVCNGRIKCFFIVFIGEFCCLLRCQQSWDLLTLCTVEQWAHWSIYWGNLCVGRSC